MWINRCHTLGGMRQWTNLTALSPLASAGLTFSCSEFSAAARYTASARWFQVPASQGQALSAVRNLNTGSPELGGSDRKHSKAATPLCYLRCHADCSTDSRPRGHQQAYSPIDADKKPAATCEMDSQKIRSL